MKTVILNLSQAFGDIIETTRVLKSIHQTLPNLEIKVKLTEGERRQILDGYLKRYGGFVSEILPLNYQIPKESKQKESEIDLTWYQDELPNHYGIHYTEAMLRTAEKQLSKILNKQITLERNVESELLFPLEKFKEEIELGKRKLEEIVQQNPNKQLIWLGTRTTGSQNRMPQSHHGNLWTDVINNLSNDFIFYEKRAPNDQPIHQEIYPKSNESLSLSAESEIIKQAEAGISVDGMQIHLAYALGNKKMLVLLGPTHPKAVIYPNTENDMLTIPDLKTFESIRNCCIACGLHGYIQISKYSQIKEIMTTRYSEFEFCPEIQKALKEKSQTSLNEAIKLHGCRALKEKEKQYDCWSLITPSKVIKKFYQLMNN